jgi:hypothetical protein
MGQPNIPFTMQESKAIRVLIIEKAKGANGSEEEGFAAEEGNVVEQGDGAGNATADAHYASGVNDDSIAGNFHGGGVRQLKFLCLEFYFCEHFFLTHL